MPNNVKFIGSMGPTLVYATIEGFVSVLTFSPASKYYWRYYDKTAIYGPFDDQESVERHITGCLVAANRLNYTVPDTVIYVDFKAKRRTG